MNKKTIEIPLNKATYEELQEVICELQVERVVKDKEIEELNDLLHKANDEVVSYANECIRLNNIIEEIGKMIEDLLDNCTPDGYTYWAYKTIYGHYLDIKQLKEGKE